MNKKQIELLNKLQEKNVNEIYYNFIVVMFIALINQMRCV